jgi:hypothetical protein
MGNLSTGNWFAKTKTKVTPVFERNHDDYDPFSSTGISFMASTPIKVCHNRRIQNHQVFAGLTACGKASMGWLNFVWWSMIS